jgi:hypothetical protein
VIAPVLRRNVPLMGKIITPGLHLPSNDVPPGDHYYISCEYQSDSSVLVSSYAI